jgi:ADP-heptose:LPS heptosyltransferase
MKRRYPNKKNVLLVNITRLGDMLQATPTIAGLKMENPNCRITVVVEKQFEEVCSWIPGIDEVIPIDLTYVVKCLHREGEGIVDAYEYFSKIIEDLRSRNFDYSLNMASSAYTALILSLVAVPRMGGWTSDEEGYRRIESEWAKLFASSVFHQNRQYNALNLVDVFRLSADVEQHPPKLMLTVSDDARVFARDFIAAAPFTNTGPIVAIQAGASQMKRQWKPAKFVELIQLLLREANARVIMTGTTKELAIINPIVNAVNSPNVAVAAGKTSIPQLAALLEASEILITGDTGPMHISVAMDTPVVSMFLASALGYETGPYGEESIVVQPTISCGPCNPNRHCIQTECHDLVSPRLIADVTKLRLAGPVRTLPSSCDAHSGVRVFRTGFDEYGVWQLYPVSAEDRDPVGPYRAAYRRLWLYDLAEFGGIPSGKPSRLHQLDSTAGLQDIVVFAERGCALLDDLDRIAADVTIPPKRIGEVGDELDGVDKAIEQIGYHFGYLGPLVRMFIFAKENLQGDEVGHLTNQMRSIYQDLIRRSNMLESLIIDESRGKYGISSH